MPGGETMNRWFTPSRFALAVLPATALVSATAFGAPTSLVCSNESRPGDPAITVDLDEGKNTAKVNYPAQTLPSTPPTYSPPRSFGPYKAIFSAKQITFSYTTPSGNETNYNRWEIDRLTGAMLYYFGIGADFEQASPNRRVMYQFNCQVAKAKF
jgi:hypothetical protein